LDKRRIGEEGSFGPRKRGKYLRTRARKSFGAERTVVILDAGTRKMCCLVARLLPSPHGQDTLALASRIRITGYGYQLSRGIHAGCIADMDAAERTVRSVVAKAERAADVTVNEVYVTTSLGPLVSQSFTAGVDLPSGVVTARDMDRVMHAAHEFAAREGQVLIHAEPFGYALGYESGIADPLGMIGDRLKVDVHAVTADALPIRNLRHCIERSHLAVTGICAAAYASARAVLSDSEQLSGVTCIDMGAGATSAAIFSGGSFIYADSVDMGGNQISSDIAHALSLSLVEAERLKISRTSVFTDTDAQYMQQAVGTGGRYHFAPLSGHIPQAGISEITRIRLEDIFAGLRDRMRAAGVIAMAGQKIVLTGGGSTINGAAEVASKVFGKDVRLGRPRPVSGLPGQEAGSAFAAPVGLLIHLLDGDLRLESDGAPEIAASGQGYLARIGHWLRESF
jgi:cell division protein FtsA